MDQVGPARIVKPKRRGAALAEMPLARRDFANTVPRDFGLVDIDRGVRPAYTALQALYVTD